MNDALTCTKRFLVRTPSLAVRVRSCAMQRLAPDLIARCSRSLAVALLLLYGAAPGAFAADSFGTPLRWPLSLEPHALRGGFGEARANHFHAGLDLSTQQAVGADVLAPADGCVERVRASGTGYGRSLYLRTDDGRLIVFGHLDAFAPQVAAYVDSVQVANGEYDVDLWPAAGRFRYAAGTRVAWSGRSGAGPPHLHVEVRHGDFALNPLLSGLAVTDTFPPRLTRVVLEPLDEGSWVERRASPHMHVIGAKAETLLVEGRVRLTVVAGDRAAASNELPVRIVGARWGEQWVECRMDSVSWAGEMSQVEWLLDAGRVLGTDGIILDAPAGWRPRFLRASREEALPIRLVQVEPGATAQPLELYATDAAGHTTTQRIWLRGPAPNERGPARDTSPLPRARRTAKGRVLATSPAHAMLARWEFAGLPERRLRVRVVGAPPGLRDVRMERGVLHGLASDSALATWDGRGWTAVMDLSNTPDPDGLWIKGRRTDGTAWWQRGSFALWPTGNTLEIRVEDWASARIEPGRMYETGVVVARSASLTSLPAGALGVGGAVELQPVSPPLARSVPVMLEVPAGLSRDRLGVYRRDQEGDTWDWADADWDSATNSFRVNTSRLGQFAMIRDTTPPVVRFVTPIARPKTGGEYSTWRLAAVARDAASGILGRASGFTVDDVKVPTEWDAEEKVLRWRPRTPPAPGTHRYRLEVRDRAGNRTVRGGTFVIASR